MYIIVRFYNLLANAYLVPLRYVYVDKTDGFIFENYFLWQIINIYDTRMTDLTDYKNKSNVKSRNLWFHLMHILYGKIVFNSGQQTREGARTYSLNTNTLNDVAFGCSSSCSLHKSIQFSIIAIQCFYHLSSLRCTQTQTHTQSVNKLFPNNLIFRPL